MVKGFSKMGGGNVCRPFFISQTTHESKMKKYKHKTLGYTATIDDGTHAEVRTDKNELIFPPAELITEDTNWIEQVEEDAAISTLNKHIFNRFDKTDTDTFLAAMHDFAAQQTAELQDRVDRCEAENIALRTALEGKRWTDEEMIAFAFYAKSAPPKTSTESCFRAFKENRRA